MKPSIRNLFHLPVLVAALSLILAGPVTAQTLTTLHEFTASDGGGPSGGLILAGNTLYGTAEWGTVFALKTDGTGFTNLHTFAHHDNWHRVNSESKVEFSHLATNAL